MSSDCGFPYIKYAKGATPKEWGLEHGKQFASAIKELVEIRKTLMLEKNPSLAPHLTDLAHKQAEVSQSFCPELMEEMQGIAEGAGVSLEDIVILNNYTDFRDITLPEEGCSTIHIQRVDKSYSGQTWDMHKSAKDYLCIIHAPETDFAPESIILSLVGCVGLMGFNTSKCLIGVNNINTENAKAGLIWPMLVRKVLYAHDLKGMRDILNSAPVTSGHNYIISAEDGGEHWEVTPEVSALVSATKKGETSSIFHTNHCLAPEVIEREQKLALNSTTHLRYGILEKTVESINSYDALAEIFRSHENFPKSICSHFESGSQDPSFTCGAGVADIQTGESIFWRGCKEHDSNYKEYSFELKDNTFVRK